MCLHADQSVAFSKMAESEEQLPWTPRLAGLQLTTPEPSMKDGSGFFLENFLCNGQCLHVFFGVFRKDVTQLMSPNIPSPYM